MSTADGQAVREVLAERARSIARPEAGAEAVESRSLLVVALGRERYGLPVEHVREIRPLDTLARVPGVGDHWLGLTNARGQLVAVLDLARHLGLDGGAGDDPHLVLVESDGLVVGLAVQAVADLSTVAVADIGPLLASSEGAPLLGLTPDLVAILDVPALLADPALVVRDAGE